MQAGLQGTSISVQKFTAGFRHRLRAMWRSDIEDGLTPTGHKQQVDNTSISLVCSAFNHNVRAPPCLPRYIYASGSVSTCLAACELL